MNCTCCSKTLDLKDLEGKECRHCGTKIKTTVTGRWLSEPNIQSIPVGDKKLLKDLKSAFLGIDWGSEAGSQLVEKKYFRSPDGKMTLINWKQCDPECHGWLHSDSPFEIERCDECARFKTDDQAVEAHRAECGCQWPEVDYQDAVHAWLDDVKNSAIRIANTTDIAMTNTLIEMCDRDSFLSNVDDFIKMAEAFLPHSMPTLRPSVEGALKLVKKVQELRDSGKLNPYQFGSSDDMPPLDPPVVPGYEALEQRSDQDRLELIRKWADWFYEHTESYKGELGMQLAYLWPAIARAKKIEVEESSAVVQILRNEGVKKSDPIWQYLDVTVDEGTDDELAEPYDRRGTCHVCKSENVPVRDDEEDPDDDICESCWIDQMTEDA